MNKFAFMTTKYLEEFIERALTEIGVHIDYELYLYKSFGDIVEVYDKIPRNIPCVIVSGRFGSGIISYSRPDASRIVMSFDADDAGMYWLLIQLMRNPSFDPARVYVDFFDIMGVRLSEYMFQRSKVTLCDQLTDFMKDMTQYRLQEIEEYVFEKHVRLWQEGRTDISVTRFASLAQRLEDMGVPVRFVYPSLNHVSDICLQALQAVQIKQLQQNLLSVIEVTVDGTAADSESAVEKLRMLENALNHFKKQNLYDFMLTPIPFGFEIYTNRKVVDELTDNGKGCRLQGFFKENLTIPVFVGYGLGDDIYQARMHAIVSNREAKLSREGCSCLINENDELIAHLGSLAQVVVKRGTYQELKRASQKSGLSSITIQKIIAIAHEMEDNLITSQDIASKLGITRRSANRFLSALIKTKVARVVSKKGEVTRGRPERVFKIVLDK